MIKLFHGDCLDILPTLDIKFDAVICDPPYGIAKNLKLNRYKKEKYAKKKEEDYKWDTTINAKFISDVLIDKVKENGRIVLFCQEPYTSSLILNCTPPLNFNYKLIWKKDHFANFLCCKKAPVSYYEEILVFTKIHRKDDFNNENPLRLYFKKVLDFIGKSINEINKILGHRKSEHSFYIESTQFELCTLSTYRELMNVFKINQMSDFLDYGIIKKINSDFLIKHLDSFPGPTFNLQGKNIKSNVLEYSKDLEKLHPTQKPVLLLEDLIKTYTNEGDTVLDFCVGSGTTGIACKNLNRNCVLIEKEKKYYDIAKDRIGKIN